MMQFGGILGSGNLENVEMRIRYGRSFIAYVYTDWIKKEICFSFCMGTKCPTALLISRGTYAYISYYIEGDFTRANFDSVCDTEL